MTFAPRRHRAQTRMLTWAQACPHRREIWRDVDARRAEQGRTIPRWPAWCYLPCGRASGVAGAAMVRAGIAPDTSSLLAETGALATYSAWRMTQGVYRYDPTLYAALQTQVEGDLPIEILRRVPEWCVYIETPAMTAPVVGGGSMDVHGVYAWLDYEAASDETILQLALDTDEASLPIANLPLVGTIAESIDRVADDWQTNAETIDGVAMPTAGYAEAARRALPPLVSLVLYLCADEAELGVGTMRPHRPTPTRTKDGWRIFPASGLTRWDVGVRLGAALSRAQSSERTREGSRTGHASPRAHIRRAHWHTFLHGPRRVDQPQERRLKWLPPVPINIGDRDDLPATIHPVGEDLR